MARRRSLGDLLKQEADKPRDLEAVQQEEQEAKSSDLDAATPDQPPAPETTTAVSVSEQRLISTTAELEKTVTELKAALQAAQKQEISYQQQIASLQSDLEKQKNLLDQLQAELRQAEQIKAELKQVKTELLQLSEANSKPSQASHALKKRPENRPKYNLIQPHSEPPKFSNADIGWVD
ncbi:MAG: hypothetical protein JOZ78_07845 [Chroococcidiopsidaceae cyanobacterium CP_BM_ER_R8_30]|nr:hypothetical protein [Chroococcidiopsidaceae cyanobacterium CP_BM_ER_R8_30]